MRIERTGNKVAFLDLHIGHPFYAHGRLWVRTAFNAATELKGSEHREFANCCDFLIDGKAKPEFGPYSHKGETCELVETVRLTDE